jgi:hypothetical protein
VGQRAAHRQFLDGKQRLVELVHRVERLARTEQVGAGGQSLPRMVTAGAATSMRAAT